MLFASWNVNSVKARLDRLLSWLDRRRPDIVCLQEIKVSDAEFPAEALQAAGYHVAVHGQKTWHGVALLAKEAIGDIRRGVGSEVEESQARLIAGTIGGVRIFSVYVPNGSIVGSDKYSYKRRWLHQFTERIRQENSGGPLLVAGDFNIAPAPEDVAHPDRWEGSVLFNPEMRDAFRGILGTGLCDLSRQHLPAGTFTWWDYRLLSFPRNDGLRLDHILASPPLAQQCEEVFVDRNERKGDRPSDHAPILARFR